MSNHAAAISSPAGPAGGHSQTPGTAPVPTALTDLPDPHTASPEALAAYRHKAWDQARAGFESCLAIAPDDSPSKVFLGRIGQFCTAAPSPDWDGVWSLAEK